MSGSSSPVLMQMWSIFNRPSTQAASSQPPPSQSPREPDVTQARSSQSGPSQVRPTQARVAQAGPSRPRVVDMAANGRAGKSRDEAILLLDSDEDTIPAAKKVIPRMQRRSSPHASRPHHVTGGPSSQMPRRAAVTPVDTDDDDIVFVGTVSAPARSSALSHVASSHGTPSHSTSSRAMPSQGTKSAPSRPSSSLATPSQGASSLATTQSRPGIHDTPRVMSLGSDSQASGRTPQPHPLIRTNHLEEASVVSIGSDSQSPARTPQAPPLVRTTSLNRSTALERRQALGTASKGLGKTLSRSRLSTPSQSPDKTSSSSPSRSATQAPSASPLRSFLERSQHFERPQHASPPSTPGPSRPRTPIPVPNPRNSPITGSKTAKSSMRGAIPVSASPSSVPLSRTVSAMSSISSNSAMAWSAAPVLAQDRKAKLHALKESGRKKAEAARPISSVDVTSRPGSPAFMDKIKRNDRSGSRPGSLTPKEEKARLKNSQGLTVSPFTNLLRSQGSRLGFSAADSPLKRPIRMSSPVTGSTQRTADECDENADPLDSRERRGKLRGVDLVEEMRKSSPNYREEDDLGDEDLLLALEAEYGHYSVPEPPAPPVPILPTDLNTTSDLATVIATELAQKIAPSTPHRRPIQRDPARTHAMGDATRRSSISPKADRFRRHLTLSPTASRTDLDSIRLRRLSASGAQRLVAKEASLSWLPPRLQSDKGGSLTTPSVVIVTERGVADIMREQEEEEARVKAMQELEMQDQADRWNASEEEDETRVESGDGSDSDLSSVPDEEDTEADGDSDVEAETEEAGVQAARGAMEVLSPERTEPTSAGEGRAEKPTAIFSDDPPLTLTAQPDSGLADASKAHSAQVMDGADAMASLLDNGKDNTAEIDLLQQLAAGAALTEAKWPGIWEKAEWAPDEASLKVWPMPDVEGCAWLGPLLELASAGDAVPLLTVLASGACVDVLDGGDGIGPCEVLQMVIDTAPSGRPESQLAMQTALSMIASASTNPFSSSQGLLGKIAHTITSLGIRAEMRHLFPAHTCPDDACDVGCGWRIRDRNEGLSCMAMLVAKCAECSWLDAEHAVQIARLFLFICIDPHTKPSTVHALQMALHELWQLCLEHLTAPGVGTEICEIACNLPTPAQRRLLGAIGSSSPQAIEIARWVGMELLLPGCLDELSLSAVHVVPPLQFIVDGTIAMNRNVVDKDRETDHGLLATQIEALCAAMNDLQRMVMTEPGKTDKVRKKFETVRRNLKVAGDSIPRNISTSHQGISNKMRLGQLANLLEVQMERLLSKRVWQKQRAKANLAKGLVLGEHQKGGNQTRLNFARLDKRGHAERERQLKKVAITDDAVTLNAGDMELESSEEAEERDAARVVLTTTVRPGSLPRTPVTVSAGLDSPSSTPPSSSRTRLASEASVDADRQAKRQRIDIDPESGDHRSGALTAIGTSKNLQSADNDTLQAYTPITANLDTVSSPRFVSAHPSLVSERFYTPPPTAPPVHSGASSPADGDTARSPVDYSTEMDGPRPRSADRTTSPSPTPGMAHDAPHGQTQPSPQRHMSQSGKVSLSSRMAGAARYVAWKTGFGGDRKTEEEEEEAVCSGRSPSPMM